MFDTITTLVQAIDSLTIRVDERDLGQAISALSTLQAKVTEAVAVFDRHRLWDTNGSTSLTGWLKDHGMTGPAGKRTAALATTTAALPVTSAAWTEGKLSAGQVEVISTQLRDDSYISLF